MNVLVTGGLGFIGSHIVDACVVRGDTVCSVDNLITGKREHGNPKAPNFEVDITNDAAFEDVFRTVRPEIVFHCAAIARIQPSFLEPARYFINNVIGTHHVIEFAKKYDVRRIVYSGSSTAYGSREELPLREDMAVSAQALSPYASSKRMGEMMMHDRGRSTGGPETVCLRYFNVYGPRQTTVEDGAYATVIGIFLSKLKAGEPLTIVPDGHHRRDFTWIGDAVQGNLLAAESPNVGNGEIINLGTGKNYAMWDVARLMLGEVPDVLPEELLASGKCVWAPPRRGEAKETLADITRAREWLRWNPTTALKEGIEKTKTTSGSLFTA
ncbi:MAG: NAD-dependent epimerase/dehydratase family protein [Candidatus Niyogibacteria bacterium]|nr:NAD-dependent epimerase/dehydratase family protein [Candidatus Niyogibacteria bacterium]